MAIHIKIFFPKAKYLFRLFSFPVIFITHAQSQPAYQPDLENAYGQYLNFQLDSCRASLQKTGDSPESFYLNSLLTATEIFVSDSIDYFKNKKKLESDLLNQVESKDYEASQKEFLKAELRIQWAILKMKYGEEFSSFWSLRQAYLITQNNIDRDTEFVPSYKSLGLLYVLFGIVPEKYRWLLSLFGVEGDVEKGMELLKRVADDENRIYGLESDLITALLNAYLLNKPEAGLGKIAEKNHSKRFLLIDYAHSLVLMKNSKSQEASQIIGSATQLYPQPYRLPQIYYLSAEINLQMGALDQAINQYSVFISHQSGKALVKDAYYKTGICYWIKGLDDQAIKYFDLAKKHGWDKNEADSYAQNQLESGHLSYRQLYSLRFATDGGFYERAKNIRKNIKIEELHDEDLCEYYYRTGRLMQSSGSLTEAISFYKKTLDSQGDQNWYYAPNAALQSGLIYLEKHDPEKAKVSLQQVYDYGNYPYEKSIRQKAKAALKNLD